jgi:nicotinamidase-related amidase
MPPLKPDTRPSGAKHDNSLPQWAIDKMTDRRGQRYAFEDIDPARTVLVIIDILQNYIGNTPCSASIIAPINRLADTMRNVGGTVAWVRPGPIAGDSPILNALWGKQHLQKNVDETRGGENQVSWAEGLNPQGDDICMEKHAASAFFPGKCDLPNILAARGIDTVIITGVLTNICCESSARDASTLGYRAIVVADANAARSDEEHQAALYNILRNFGDVRMTDELIGVLQHTARHTTRHTTE